MLVTVAGGPIHVELLPDVGARLHRLRVFGHDLLRTPDDPAKHAQEPFRWGAYVMAPWGNRIASAPTPVGDRLVRVISNFPDGSAIHGQVYAAAWHPRGDGTFRVRCAGDGWPWPYECAQRVTIHRAVLVIDQWLTNLADGPMPAGLGWHPWFQRPVDVRINAADVLRSNIDLEAVVEPVSGAWDLRRMRPMPENLDAAWPDPGDPAVELRWPELGITAVMRVRSNSGVCIVAASPHDLEAIAIEPQTHLPQGLRRWLTGEKGGLQSLAPGAAMRLSTELAFEMT